MQGWPVALPLDAMTMFTILDEDTEVLQGILGQLNAFLGAAEVSSGDHATACRQRDSIHLELSERSASAAILAPIRVLAPPVTHSASQMQQPYTSTEPAAAAMTPSAAVAAPAAPAAAGPLDSAESTPPQASAPSATAERAPLQLSLVERIRAAQRAEGNNKLQQRKERAEKAMAMEKAATAEKAAAKERAIAAQRAAVERIAAMKRKSAAAAVHQNPPHEQQQRVAAERPAPASHADRPRSDKEKESTAPLPAQPGAARGGGVPRVRGRQSQHAAATQMRDNKSSDGTPAASEAAAVEESGEAAAVDESGEAAAVEEAILTDPPAEGTDEPACRYGDDGCLGSEGPADDADADAANDADADAANDAATATDSEGDEVGDEVAEEPEDAADAAGEGETAPCAAPHEREHGQAGQAGQEEALEMSEEAMFDAVDGSMAEAATPAREACAPEEAVAEVVDTDAAEDAISSSGEGEMETEVEAEAEAQASRREDGVGTGDGDEDAAEDAVADESDPQELDEGPGPRETAVAAGGGGEEAEATWMEPERSFVPMPRAQLATFLDDDDDDDEEEEGVAHEGAASGEHAADDAEGAAEAAELAAAEAAAYEAEVREANFGAFDESRLGPDGEAETVAADDDADAIDDDDGAAAMATDDATLHLLATARPLDRTAAVDRLRLLFPLATDAAIGAATDAALTSSPDAESIDFGAVASALYRQLLLVNPSRASSHAMARSRSRPADGASGFVPPFAKFDDLFGGVAPSLAVLQAHSTAHVELAGAYGSLGGAPQPPWEWRSIRVQQAKQEVYDIIRDVLKSRRHGPAPDRLRWVELPSAVRQRSVAGTWDVLWTWRQPKIAWEELLPWQRVNHFPQARQLTRKDLLKKHLQRQQRLSERAAEAFDIMPLTFTLPAELLPFTDAFSRCAEEAAAAEGTAPPNVWIMKPVGLSRGRGISMVDCISEVTYGEPMVIQRYVPNPLLLDGYKFDLRLYVLVTSFHPLEAFIYTEGFGRLATEPYSLAHGARHNLFVHLTNSSIQKERTDARHAAAVPSLDAANGGTKCALSQLRRRLAAAGVDVPTLWARIVDVVLRSLYAVSDAVPAQPNAFELFGYDVLIDETLKPWLIEVNSSPSLGRDNPLDVAVKEALVADTLSLIAPPHVDRAIWGEMLRWRLAERSGGRAAPPLHAELCALLHGSRPRAYGEPVPPASAGLYERIAPSAEWERLCAGRRGGAPAAAPHAGGGGTAPGAGPRRERPRFDVPAPTMRRQPRAT